MVTRRDLPQFPARLLVARLFAFGPLAARVLAARILAMIACLWIAFGIAAPAQADPADIAAAARGVVRVVIVGREGEMILPISHGTGFAVAPGKIITNAHVVEDMLRVDGLGIVIVPSEGGNAVMGRLVTISPRNDLALVEARESVKLPPLTIAAVAPEDSALVSAVGYPMNVDRAQGLDLADVFVAQPPVKSRGFISGERPSRAFDTILHTAPIARGNSGGPLLDNCGRVVGVNSFGADTQGADAEFFFAVSARELIPFLHANGITPKVNNLPCRSLAELDAEERSRAERSAAQALEAARQQKDKAERQRDEAQRKAQFAVLAERENRMALAAILLLIAIGAGFHSVQARGKASSRIITAARIVAAVALAGAALAWFTRPGLDEIEERTAASLARANGNDNSSARAGDKAAAGDASEAGARICVIDVARSRVTASDTADIPLQWREDGCVNGRTQYGLSGGQWSRAFVPNDEESVSVATYDPQRREYRVERYLLGRTAIEAARAARARYSPPSCGGGEPAALELGENQAAILGLLPAQPNERLVYRCSDTAR